MNLKYNEQYKNYNLELKSVPLNSIIHFTMKFDDPKVGDSKFENKDGSPKEYQLYSVTLHTDEGDKDVSFFAQGQSEEEYVSFGEYLKRFNKGDSVAFQKTVHEFAPGKFTTKWLKVEDEPTSSPPQTPTSTPDKSDEEVVDMLLKSSGNEKKSDMWVVQTLTMSGITDEGRMTKIVNAYKER